MDWKDALAGLRESLPEGEKETEAGENSTPEAKGVQREPLRVVIDRKARKGKTATIVEGFLCPDEEVADIAKKLKQKLGTGGSSRDGEILLQGDWRDKTADYLRSLGYKVKL